MREDIRGGLKNALERGENLEKAIKTFVNAGYKESDVRDEASLLEGTISAAPVTSASVLQTQVLQPAMKKELPPFEPPKQSPLIQQQNQQPIQIRAQQQQFGASEVKGKRKGLGKLIILSTASLILLILLILSFIFRNKIIDIISSFI